MTGALLLLLVMAANVFGAIQLLRTRPCPWCASRYWIRRRKIDTWWMAGETRIAMKGTLPVCLQCEFWESKP